MTADRIKEIQGKTAFPDSVSVCQALFQVWNECQQDMAKERKEIQPEDIWNKESRDKIKEHILNHANNQSSEDMADKKYTEEDMRQAFEFGLMNEFKTIEVNNDNFDYFIKSLNKK